MGPQGQEGFHSESQLQPSCKLKTKKKSVLTMTIASPHQPYLLIYKLATETVTALLEYLDLDCSIRVYQSFKQLFKGGSLGAPFKLGARVKIPPVGGPAHYTYTPQTI